MRDRKLDRLFRRFAARGDTRALGAVFDALAPELLGLARHLTRDAAEAEDALQATFVTAMERARDFDPERSFRPWVSGILVNHARALLRARGRSPDPDAMLRPPEQDASAPAQQAEFDAAVRDAVDGLPESYRAILQPHLLEGASPSETARRLGITPNAARVRLSRGLALLRRSLPAGFSLGVAATTAPESIGRGLAAVRAAVMAEAQVQAVALAATPVAASPLLLGGLVVTQRALSFSIAAVVLAGAATWFWAGSDGPTRAGSPSAGAEPAVAPRVAANAPVAALGPTAEERVAPAAAERAPRARLPRFVGRVVTMDGREPLEGAVVWSAPPDTPGRRELARSASDGRFAFDGVAGDERGLFVEAAGRAPYYTAEDPGRRTQQGSWAETFAASGTPAAPPASEAAIVHLEQVDLGDLRLAPGLALSGRVVRASDGAPIDGAEVLLLLDDGFGSSPRPWTDRPIGRSDARGDLVLHGPLPVSGDASIGSYLLLAVSDLGIGWQRVSFAPGKARVDGVTIEIVDGARLEVLVEDPEGRPLAGAAVQVLPLMPPLGRGRSSLESSGFLPLPSTLAAHLDRTTDADGVAEYAHLWANPAVPGDFQVNNRYQLRVTLEGYSPFERQIAWRGTDFTPVEVTLVPDRDTRLRGRVVDEAGAPVESANVTLRETGAARRTDASGRFELTRAAGGERLLTVQVAAEGYLPAERTVQVTPGAAELEVGDVSLRAPLPIAGVVVDGDGLPIEGASVFAQSLDVDARILQEDGRTARDGSFRFETAHAGRWALQADKRTRDAEFASVSGFEVRGGDEHVRIVLERRAVVRARAVIDVVDARTGAPVEPSNTMLLALDPEASGAHGIPERAPGRITIDGLAAGDYDLWVAAPGYGNGLQGFHVPDDGTEARARVALFAPVAIAGVVRFEGGAAPERAWVDGALVTAGRSVPGGDEWEEGSKAWTRAPLESDGSFALTHLTPGTWRLTLSARGFLLDETQVDTADGDDAEVALVARPGALVTFVPERPLAAGWFKLELHDGQEWGNATMRKASEDPPVGIVRTLPTGSVRWRVTFVEIVDFREVELAEAQEGALEVTAGEPTHVEVRVQELE